MDLGPRRRRDELRLGNLDAKRDEDFAIVTGETTTVRRCDQVGLDWRNTS
jgi:hypothetical protein